jgi:hypothetical protein
MAGPNHQARCSRQREEIEAPETQIANAWTRTRDRTGGYSSAAALHPGRGYLEKPRRRSAKKMKASKQ